MGKRKAAWRKAKIEDVEEALEDDKLVNKLRKKGTSRKEAADVHDLFTVDTVGAGEGLSARTRREIARAKLFPPKGPNIGLSAYEEAKIERAGRALEASKAPKAQGPEVFDIWSEKTKMEKVKESRDGSTVKLLPMPRPCGQPKKAGEKVSDAPAVLLAHEGQSINPLPSSYEDIAFIAAAKEIEREKGEEILNREKRPMTCELVDAFGAEAVEEMDEETKVLKYRSLKCKTSLGDEAEGDAEGQSYLGKPAKVKRKSQAKRNRAQVRVHVEEKQRQIKAQRKMEKSVGQMGTMLAEMKEKEEFYKERAAYRKAIRAKRKDREAQGAIGKCVRIGRARITEETIAVPNPDAAGKGLRSMSVKGNAIQERMASFMRRGLTVPLPEKPRPEDGKRKKGITKMKKKIISPLLRENLMLS